jgi:hypothetical protein
MNECTTTLAVDTATGLCAFFMGAVFAVLVVTLRNASRPYGRHLTQRRAEHKREDLLG